MARPLRRTVLDHAFTDLARDPAGRATVELRDPASGHAVALWVDAAHTWLMVYTADDATDAHRRSVAIEPMTAQADAFRSGEDLLMLAPAGDQEFSATWGIHVLDVNAGPDTASFCSTRALRPGSERPGHRWGPVGRRAGGARGP